MWFASRLFVFNIVRRINYYPTQTYNERKKRGLWSDYPWPLKTDWWSTNNSKLFLCVSFRYPAKSAPLPLNLLSYNLHTYFRRSGLTWFSNVNCNGYESTISSCKKDTVGHSRFACGDAEVICKGKAWIYFRLLMIK